GRWRNGRMAPARARIWCLAPDKRGHSSVREREPRAILVSAGTIPLVLGTTGSGVENHFLAAGLHSLQQLNLARMVSVMGGAAISQHGMPDLAPRPPGIQLCWRQLRHRGAQGPVFVFEKSNLVPPGLLGERFGHGKPIAALQGKRAALVAAQ